MMKNPMRDFVLTGLLELRLAVIVGIMGPGVAWAQPAAQPSANPPDVIEAATEGPWMDGVSIERQTSAREIFLQGNALMKDAFFAEAAVKYWEALARWDHPAFHFNLAMAQRVLDQPIKAHASLGRAMRYGAAPLGSQKYEHAKRVLELLEDQLAYIEVICNDDGAEVTFDGKPLFTGPDRFQGLVRPGPHQLVASKPGRVAETRQVTLNPGKKARFELSLGMPGRVELKRRWPWWLPVPVAGASIAFFAGGAYFDRASTRKFDDYDSQVETLCAEGAGCDRSQLSTDIIEIRQRAERQQWIARLTYLAGGAALATGLVLAYLNREQPVHIAGEKDLSNIVLIPLFSGDGAGVNLGVRF